MTTDSSGLIAPSLPPTSILRLLGESARMVLRYFILVYPVFLYFILYAFLAAPIWHARHFSPALGIVIGGLGAIYLLFCGGWNRMMLLAVQEWQIIRHALYTGKPASIAIKPVPFNLLAAFVPGIGQYGVPFLLSGILVILLQAVPLGILAAIGVFRVGLPYAFLQTVSQHPTMTQSQLNHLILSSPPAVYAQLTQWGVLCLCALLLMMVINGLTLFWQQLILIKDASAWQAIVYSMQTAIKRPFKTIFIVLLISFIYITVGGMVSVTPIGKFLNLFTMIVLFVYFELFKYLYILNTDAVPAD